MESLARHRQALRGSVGLAPAIQPGTAPSRQVQRASPAHSCRVFLARSDLMESFARPRQALQGSVGLAPAIQPGTAPSRQVQLPSSARLRQALQGMVGLAGTRPGLGCGSENAVFSHSDEATGAKMLYFHTRMELRSRKCCVFTHGCVLEAAIRKEPKVKG